MSHETNQPIGNSTNGKKEADLRIRIKTVSEKIENQRIERLSKKPLHRRANNYRRDKKENPTT
jgi:hypothetical protein